MSEQLILTFDVGTQSMLASLIAPDGRTAAAERVVYEKPYYSLHPNWAEQRPDFYFEALCTAAGRLADRAGEAMSRASAVALTSFRNTAVCVDKQGRPLRDAILWMDQRQAQNPKKPELWRRALFAVAGMTETVHMLHRTSACNWLAENEKEMWDRMDKYVMLSTYLNFRLTGQLRDSAASMIALFPFDYKHRRWDKNGLTRCLYDIPQDKLCDTVPSGEVIGYISPEASALSGIPAGLPLIATGADKACETLGLSVTEPGKAAVSFGTSATVEFASKRYYEPTPFMPAYPAVPNDLYHGEIQLWRGYWMLTWFKENFAQEECRRAEELGVSAESLLDAHLQDIPPGCDGLMVLPHWTPGLATPRARGAMIGFSDVHTKYHVYRAIVEGINFGLMDGLYTMQRSARQRIKALYAAGGGAKSDAILQITANMFGLPVHRIQTNEACSLGAAMCAYVALEYFPDYERAIGNMVHVKDVFYPDMEEHRLYKALYDEVYSRCYKTLHPLHKCLGRLTARPTAGKAAEKESLSVKAAE